MRTLADTNFKRNDPVIQARAKVRAALANKNEVAWIMHHVAEGYSIRRIAIEMGLEYSILHQMLRSQFNDQLDAARAARAESLAETNLETADRMENGTVEPKAGAAAASIRQWYAERVDPDRWGKQSSVNVTHKGVIGLHLEAIQQLANVPLEGEVVDAEYQEAQDESETQGQGPEADPVPEDHPLL